MIVERARIKNSRIPNVFKSLPIYRTNTLYVYITFLGFPLCSGYFLFPIFFDTLTVTNIYNSGAK